VFGCPKLCAKSSVFKPSDYIEFENIWTHEEENLPENFKTLKTFTFDMFIDFCILNGCDYLSSLPKVGLKTAIKYIAQHKTIEEVVHWMKVVKEWFTP